MAKKNSSPQLKSRLYSVFKLKLATVLFLAHILMFAFIYYYWFQGDFRYDNIGKSNQFNSDVERISDIVKPQLKSTIDSTELIRQFNSYLEKIEKKNVGLGDDIDTLYLFRFGGYSKLEKDSKVLDIEFKGPTHIININWIYGDRVEISGDAELKVMSEIAKRRYSIETYFICSERTQYWAETRIRTENKIGCGFYPLEYRDFLFLKKESAIYGGWNPGTTTATISLLEDLFDDSHNSFTGGTAILGRDDYETFLSFISPDTLRTTKSFYQMLYFSAVTSTTLGYGDILPESDEARMIVAFQSVSGLILMGFIIWWITQPASVAQINSKQKAKIRIRTRPW